MTGSQNFKIYDQNSANGEAIWDLHKMADRSQIKKILILLHVFVGNPYMFVLVQLLLGTCKSVVTYIVE